MKHVILTIALLMAPLAFSASAAHAIPCWDGIKDECSPAPEGFYECRLTQDRCPA